MTLPRIPTRPVVALILLSAALSTTPVTAQCEDPGGPDCNVNGIPDICELSGAITLQSGQMGPVDSQTPQEFNVSSPPVALDDLTLTCTAQANLAHWTERIDVWINDTPLRSVFLFSADCAPVAESFVVPMETYMEALATGRVVFRFVPSASVNVGFCSESFVKAAVALNTLPSLDENHNGVLDECEEGDAPALCMGFEPTIYVGDDGRIVGGPLGGTRFNGVLVGTPGDDVIMGTSGNDLIVGAAGDDRICGNGGNDHITREPQGRARGHEAARGKAKGRKK